MNVPLVNETQLIFSNELLDCDIEWIDSKLAGTQDGKAAGILEECILDDEDGKCERGSPMPCRNLMRCLELLPRNSFNRERKALR